MSPETEKTVLLPEIRHLVFILLFGRSTIIMNSCSPLIHSRLYLHTPSTDAMQGIMKHTYGFDFEKEKLFHLKILQIYLLLLY